MNDVTWVLEIHLPCPSSLYSVQRVAINSYTGYPEKLASPAPSNYITAEKSYGAFDRYFITYVTFTVLYLRLYISSFFSKLN